MRHGTTTKKKMNAKTTLAAARQMTAIELI